MDHSNHNMDTMNTDNTMSTTNMDINNGAMQHNMMTMTMFFHTGFKELILFEFWQTKSINYFILSCFIVFLLSLLSEGLKLLRFKAILYEKLKNQKCECPTVSSVEAIEKSTSSRLKVLDSKEKLKRYFSIHAISQSLLYMLHGCINYALMLIFMTFNIWLCLMIILGSGVGYLLFVHNKVKSFDFNNENCH